MPHKHGVYDTDPYFVLKKQTRTLTNKSTTPTKVMQFDHNCERITLELPRIIDGHDMTLCNSVQVHYINIDASNKDVQKFGVYEVTDLQAAKDDESIAICSWLISQNATQYIGPLYFVFSFRCLDENGEITYRLNTARYEELAVSTGIDNGQYIAEEYADILAQWETRIEALEFENINTLSELYCEETESEFISGATDAHYLKFRGQSLRFVGDGAVIASVMPVKKDGQSYLRLRLNDNRSVIINDNIPDFVDIPVSAIVEKEEVTGGIILNGSEIELPSGGAVDSTNYYTKQEIDDKGFITKANIPTDESYELIGETPLTLAEKSNIKLESAVETSYEAKTPTVWNFDDVFASGDYTLTKCTLERENDHYKLVSSANTTDWYQSYLRIDVPVKAGEAYILCWDNSASKKESWDIATDWGGMFSVYDGTDASIFLANKVNADENTSITVTPTTDILQIRYHPASHRPDTIKAGVIARFNAMWLNEGAEIKRTEPYNISGTFNGSITLQKVPEGATVTTTPTAKVYVKAPTDKTLSKSDVPADAKVTGESIEAVKNLLPLYGKTIVNFGDSIFGNAQPPVDISTHLANKTGATVYNCGFGGCRMTPHSVAEYAAFSMCNLATAISSGDFTQQENAVASTTVTLNNSIKANFEKLKNIDFSKVDIVTISYGTNDYYNNGVNLDNEENPLDVSTYGGALRYSIETLLNKYPNLRIFILSIAYRFFTDENNEFVDDSNTHANNYGKFIRDYNTKLQEVAAEYNLLYVDDYNIGIGKYNRYQYFPIKDGTHHNETGRKLIAEHLATALCGGNNSYLTSGVYERVEAPASTKILPNKEYVFGEVTELTVSFAESTIGKRNEYLFSFISGETATVLTLPSSVRWVNELTVEANKRYEISVVDNVALWCAVDMAVSE